MKYLKQTDETNTWDIPVRGTLIHSVHVEDISIAFNIVGAEVFDQSVTEKIATTLSTHFTSSGTAANAFAICDSVVVMAHEPLKTENLAAVIPATVNFFRTNGYLPVDLQDDLTEALAMVKPPAELEIEPAPSAESAVLPWDSASDWGEWYSISP